LKIICGKGNHSHKDKPVLKNDIMKLLDDLGFEYREVKQGVGVYLVRIQKDE